MDTGTTSNKLVLILKGMAMGAADVVPGVSGGTIAFITGIYETLINSIKAINLTSIKLLFTGKPLAFWKAINGNFLITLLTGIAISIFSLAKLMGYLLHTHPILVWSFFFGLIVASAIYIGKSIKKWHYSTFIAIIAGAVIAYLITIISPAEPISAPYFVFLSGAIAICAMILPGISGSFILVLLGMYGYILNAVSNLNLFVIFVFIAGAAVGIISFSNLLSWLLKNFHNLTIAVLTGFMIGSLNKVWPWKEVTETMIDRHGEVKTIMEINILPSTYEAITQNSSLIYPAILLAITGFALIFVIEGFTARKS